MKLKKRGDSLIYKYHGIDFEVLKRYENDEDYVWSENLNLSEINVDNINEFLDGLNMVGYQFQFDLTQYEEIIIDTHLKHIIPVVDTFKNNVRGGRMINDFNIKNGDALQELDRLIEKGVKVDAIIADIPYGTTACEWDEIIPLKDMWERLNKIVKDDNTPILLFGQQPFTSVLISSNIKNYKFNWYYKKLIASNFASAKYQPMKHIEDIVVFTKSGKKVNYYPIMQERSKSGKKRIQAGYIYNSETPNETMGNIKRNMTEQEYNPDLKYPENIQDFNNRAKGARGFHPTQKPIELMEYLVKSHTVIGDIVLDFTMGSGTTGVACLNLKRKFIGIEKDENYFHIAKKRIEEHIPDYNLWNLEGE